jgi:hypothetical protein
MAHVNRARTLLAQLLGIDGADKSGPLSPHWRQDFSLPPSDADT